MVLTHIVAGLACYCVNHSVGDVNEQRRDTVRKKLDGYLSHAEELHDKFLVCSEQDRIKVN